MQRDGSFCEYVAMPLERIIPGMGLSAKELALIEPFSVGYHALSRAKIEPTDRVLVVGSGPIGLFALISAKLRGAQVYVSDMLAGRLQTALEYGADGVIDVSKQDFMEEVNRITCGSRNAYTKDFKALIRLVAAGKVDVLKMVSAVYPMEEAAQAFESLVHNDGSLKKVLIEISK